LTFEASRILAIMAHPDDIEFVCAGTLILLRNAGCHITMINVANGDCGSMDTPPEKIAVIRDAEAKTSAALIGADHACVGLHDLRVFRTEETQALVTEAVRRANPDIVFTHPPSDYMSDHEVTSLLARDACFIGPMPNYKTGAKNPAPVLAHPPYLYYGDRIRAIDSDGRMTDAAFYVDITSVIDKKVEMLCCHASQRDWLRRQHDVDEYVEMLKAWNAARGKEVGVKYAEAFRQSRGHGFPPDNKLRELIRPFVIETS